MTRQVNADFDGIPDGAEDTNRMAGVIRGNRSSACGYRQMNADGIEDVNRNGRQDLMKPIRSRDTDGDHLSDGVERRGNQIPSSSIPTTTGS